MSAQCKDKEPGERAHGVASGSREVTYIGCNASNVLNGVSTLTGKPMNRSLLLSAPVLILLAACSREPEPEPVAVQPVTETPAVAKPIEMKPVPMAYEEPIVGGARMSAGKDILTNLGNSKDHTILVAAIKSAGLEEILRGSGPFTLFAPNDGAFRRMAGGYEELMKPENRERLISVLTYHLVPARLDADTLAQRVMAGNGSAQLETVEGGNLKVTVGDGSALLVDTKGTVAKLTTPNVLQSNGVVQVIDTVLMP